MARAIGSWAIIVGAIALQFAFVMASVRIDWSSDVPPAWLQALGGFLSLAVALYIAVHETRLAASARRKIAAQEAAAAAAAREALAAWVETAKAVVARAEHMVLTSDWLLEALEADVTQAYQVWVREMQAVADDLRFVAGKNADPDFCALLLRVSSNLRQPAQPKPVDAETFRAALAGAGVAIIEGKHAFSTFLPRDTSAPGQV